MGEVAREAGMSPFHFIRRFEALFGVTPHQFRIGAPLDRAKLPLAADNRSGLHRRTGEHYSSPFNGACSLSMSQTSNAVQRNLLRVFGHVREPDPALSAGVSLNNTTE
jgi:AraC-like DNA-binding protein